MSITYQDLLNQLQTFSLDQLKQTVTVFNSENNEFYPVNALEFTEDDTDVLDTCHPVLVFNYNA